MSDGPVFHDAQAEILERMETAANYNAWLLERARPWLRGRVLDAGAGTGTFAVTLASVCDEVVAVEPDPALLPALRARAAALPNLRVVAAPLGPELDAGGAVDAVVCFNVLEHVADDRGALAALHGLLRPGGALLVLVPAHRVLFGETDRVLGHERRYTRGLLATRLREAELQPVELRYVNPVGALGWLVSSRLLGRRTIPAGPLAVYDRAVPLLRALDALRLPFGLSLWAVAMRS